MLTLERKGENMLQMSQAIYNQHFWHTKSLELEQILFFMYWKTVSIIVDSDPLTLFKSNGLFLYKILKNMKIYSFDWQVL